MTSKPVPGKGLQRVEYWLRAGLASQEYEQIAAEIYRSNCQNLVVYSSIATAFLLVMVLISLFSSAVDENRWIYCITLSVTFLQFLLAKFRFRNHPKLLLLNLYGFIGILFLFGILLGTVANPDQTAVTFIALVLTVPILFTDKPVRMIATIVLYTLVFVVAAIRTKDASVLSIDLINACMFGTISCIVSTYLMKIKCQNILYEQQVAFLNETDLLTGLKNRNHFEHRYPDYPQEAKNSVSCVFLDVNGLHEVNNLQSHEAGDNMLRYVAQITQQQFGYQDTYRIGGDEFLAFVTDGSSEEIEEKIRAIVIAAKKQHYTVSIGYATAFHPSIDMAALIRTADQHMYQDKEAFYQQQEAARKVRK